MENAFADLIPGARKGPTRASERELQMRATQEGIQSAQVNQAQGMQDILTAPVQRARAQTALQVESATVPAQVAKTNADAQRAVIELERLKQQKGFLDLKEQQALAAARAVLMARGERMYGEAVRKGYEPTSLRNRLAAVAQGLPTIGDATADLIRDPTSEAAAQGQRIFTEGALRTVTGSAGPKEERPQTQIQYFPSAWQSRNPKLRTNLAALRAEQLATAQAVAGPALGAAPRASIAPKALPQGLTPAGARAQAKAAIAAGKPREAVLKRLRDLGVDTAGL